MANRVYVALRVHTEIDENAIVIEIDSYHMSIAATRELSNELAKAADEAEAKLSNQPTLP